MDKMKKDEFAKKVKEWYMSKIACELVDRAVSEVEDIYAVFCKKQFPNINDEHSYYVITDKRFIKFHLSFNSFGYKYCSLKLFNRFEEIIIPRNGEIRSIDSFLDDESPGTYTVRFFFNTEDDELKKIEFTLISWEVCRREYNRLKKFIREFNEAVARS